MTAFRSNCFLWPTQGRREGGRGFAARLLDCYYQNVQWLSLDIPLAIYIRLRSRIYGLHTCREGNYLFRYVFFWLFLLLASALPFGLCCGAVSYFEYRFDF